MRDLAPDIMRQRLLIEGYYTVSVDRDVVEDYLTSVAGHLALRPYGLPTIHSPAGTGRSENQGFDAFIPLIDSGICLYIWRNQKFFSVVLYSCKQFDGEEAVAYTQSFFSAEQIVHSSF